MQDEAWFFSFLSLAVKHKSFEFEEKMKLGTKGSYGRKSHIDREPLECQNQFRGRDFCFHSLRLLLMKKMSNLCIPNS